MAFWQQGQAQSKVCWTVPSAETSEPTCLQDQMPPNLAGVHDIFYISQLRKCVYDPSHVISYEPLDIQPNLTYEELPVQMLDRKEQQLRTKTITLVKVLSQNHGVELEQRERYPHLFEWTPVWTLDSYHFSIILWIKMLDYKCVKRFSVQNFED